VTSQLQPPITTVIRHGRILTMDARSTVLEDGALLLSENRITVVCASSDRRVEAALTTGAQVIDADGGLVLPGMINTHTHLGMTVFRGTADDRDLQGFLAAIWPLEEAFVTAETVLLGTTIAIAESLQSGVTTAADMYFHNGVSAEAAQRIGFRLITGPTLLGGLTVEFADFDAAFAAARDWLVNHEPGLALRTSICPHSTYTLTDRQLRRVAALSAEFDALVQIHASENEGEIAMVREQHDATPTEVLQRTGLLEGHILMAHSVHLSDGDLDLIDTPSERTRGLSHCPASNMKLASGVARIPEILRRGLALGLGTDGPASSNDLDLFAAMRLGGMLHALTSGPGAVTAKDLVTLATIGGARALGIEHWVGSLEAGKLADVVILDGHSPLSVGTDPYSTVVYSMGRAEVRTVLVDGVIRVEGGRTIGVDAAALQAEAAELVSRYPVG
jgi:5-methylthioadenosine/S-adenosylhomocysteine deaminase